MRASAIRAPDVLIVPPSTVSPSPTSRGTGSPVIIEVSTADEPTITLASVAIRSPGLVRKRSPTRSSAIGTISSWPSRMTLTVVGASFPNACSTPRADRLDRAST